MRVQIWTLTKVAMVAAIAHPLTTASTTYAGNPAYDRAVPHPNSPNSCQHGHHGGRARGTRLNSRERCPRRKRPRPAKGSTKPPPVGPTKRVLKGLALRHRKAWPHYSGGRRGLPFTSRGHEPLDSLASMQNRRAARRGDWNVTTPTWPPPGQLWW